MPWTEIYEQVIWLELLFLDVESRDGNKVHTSTCMYNTIRKIWLSITQSLLICTKTQGKIPGMRQFFGQHWNLEGRTIECGRLCQRWRLWGLRVLMSPSTEAWLPSILTFSLQLFPSFLRHCSEFQRYFCLPIYWIILKQNGHLAIIYEHKILLGIYPAFICYSRPPPLIKIRPSTWR